MPPPKCLTATSAAACLTMADSPGSGAVWT
jgi:hypothetical protein